VDPNGSGVRAALACHGRCGDLAPWLLWQEEAMMRVLHPFGGVAIVVVGMVGAWAAPAQAQICAPFTDVLASSGFCTNIQWLFNRGVTQGCTATQFCPANFVRRDQIAALLNASQTTCSRSTVRPVRC
jgi:hypothetical protein